MFLFKYDEALNICYALEERTENNEEKVKVFWLISDILLLQNDFDNSFLWAKKAHELTSTLICFITYIINYCL